MQRNKIGSNWPGGLGIGVLPLAEASFAAAPGAAYAPPERGLFRVVAGRVIQLLGDSAGFLITTQSSAGTVRLPSGLTATDDAGEGRYYFLWNNGTGTITVQDHLGGAVASFNPGNKALLFHGVNNAWTPTISIGAGMTTTAPTSHTTTVSAAATNYDLLQAGSVSPPAGKEPQDLNPLWTPNGFAELHLEVDLSAMLAGDDATITIEKQVDGASWETLETLNLSGVQNPTVTAFKISTNTGFPVRCGIQRAAGAAYAAEVLYWGVGAAP